LKNGSFKLPAWIQSFECHLGRFRIPYWFVLAFFLGMLSWSLFCDLDRVDMNVWDESLFAIRAYQLYENGSFLQNFNQFAGLYDHPSTKLPLVTLIQVGSFYVWGPTVWALRFPIGIIALVGILLSARILVRMGIDSKLG
jgi:4-amino-4-deoxy-L-arabinose transferase-like glycosyltransferase